MIDDKRLQEIVDAYTDVAFDRSKKALMQTLKTVRDECMELENTGWVKWYGGICPVDGTAQVVTRLRYDPSTIKGPFEARAYRWTHINNPGDIIEYRVVSPESVKEKDWRKVPLTAGMVLDAINTSTRQGLLERSPHSVLSFLTKELEKAAKKEAS